MPKGFQVDADTLLCLNFEEVIASAGAADRSGRQPSGINQTGTPAILQSGPVVWSRKVTGSAFFEGIAQYGSWETDLGGNCTAEFLYKADPAGSGYRSIFHVGNGSNWWFHALHGSYGGLELQYKDVGGGVFISPFPLFPVSSSVFQLWQVRKTVTAAGVSPPSTRLNTIEIWCTDLGTPWSATHYTVTGKANPHCPTTVYLAAGREAISGSSPGLGWLGGLRVTKRALTDGEIEQSANDVLVEPGSGEDETAPTVAVVSPASNLIITPSTQLVIDVTDNVLLRRVLLVARTGGLEEVVHNGNAFGPMYSRDPNRREAISGGYRYTLLRRGGWPSSPTIDAYPFDTAGNESA